MKTKILIVEDDSSISMGLKFCLEQEGFDVYCALCGKEALDFLFHEPFDLVLLDVNLPDMNGFEILKQIHEKVPVIFLTANDSEVSIVQGLDMGAWDYITKPFRTRELISRMKSVLRRGNASFSKRIYIQNLEIDPSSAKVFKNNQEITNPNVVFTREKMLADIWDVNEEYVNDNTLTVYIKRLREKIEDDPNHPKIIETVRGVGYKIGDPS